MFTAEAAEDYNGDGIAYAYVSCGWHDGACRSTVGTALDFPEYGADASKAVRQRAWGTHLNVGSGMQLTSWAWVYEQTQQQGEVCYNTYVRVNTVAEGQQNTPTNAVIYRRYLHVQKVGSSPYWMGLFSVQGGWFLNEDYIAVMKYPDWPTCPGSTGYHVHSMHLDPGHPQANIEMRTYYPDCSYYPCVPNGGGPYNVYDQGTWHRFVEWSW